jgi:Cu2+-exporting ATPase
MPHFLIITSGVIFYLGIKWYQTLKINQGSPNQSETKRLMPPEEALNQPTGDLSYTENAIDRDFSVASISLALATAGSLFYRPLSLVSMFGVSYTMTPIWQNGYQSLAEKKQFNMTVIDSIAVAGFLLTNNYFLAAITNWLFIYVNRLIFKTKDQFQKSIIHFFFVKKLPRFIWLLKDGAEIEVPLETLKVGDIVVVNAGEMIPVDGTLIDGTASINQSILSGDPQPLEKRIGDQVLALSIVLSGKICIQVDRWGKETVAGQMAEMAI